MPIYEYRAVEDGQVIELIRPVADADKPVVDPAGRGRNFTRIQSAFRVSSGASASRSLPAPSSGGCCPCGDPSGPCNVK